MKLMKNLLSLLTEISKWLKVHSVATRAERNSTSPAWEKLGILLNTQAQVRAMDAGEPRSFPTSIKPEELDMALRELRLAQRSALSELEHDGVISEDVLNKLCTHIDSDISGLASSREYPASELHLSENENE